MPDLSDNLQDALQEQRGFVHRPRPRDLWTGLVLVRRPTADEQHVHDSVSPQTEPVLQRSFAKRKCNSAQGEILSADEIRLLVEAFGFECDVCQDPDQDVRRSFIRNALAAQHPVLIAYSWDNRKNHNEPDPTGRLDKNGGRIGP